MRRARVAIATALTATAMVVASLSTGCDRGPSRPNAAPAVSVRTIEAQQPAHPSARLQDGALAEATVVRTSSGRTVVRTSSSRIELSSEDARIRELITRLNREHGVEVEGLERPARAEGDTAWDTALEWKPLFKGIDHVEIRASRPRQMVGQALRVDLRAEGISFFTTPSNGAKSGETDGMKTSTFLSTFGLAAAINAAPFSPIWGSEGRPQEIRGLAVSDGEIVSTPNGYPSIRITKDNRVTIGSTPRNVEEVHNAVCGFDMILENGRPARSGGDTHPRVCAGVSKDGHWFYMLVVDGRQWGHSMGAQRRDLAEWLLKMGAWDGINLDGGGTSTIVVADSRGRARVLNRPIHGGRPGNQRVSGSHLGVRALRLD